MTDITIPAPKFAIGSGVHLLGCTETLTVFNHYWQPGDDAGWRYEVSGKGSPQYERALEAAEPRSSLTAPTLDHSPE